MEPRGYMPHSPSIQYEQNKNTKEEILTEKMKIPLDER